MPVTYPDMSTKSQNLAHSFRSSGPLVNPLECAVIFLHSQTILCEVLAIQDYAIESLCNRSIFRRDVKDL